MPLPEVHEIKQRIRQLIRNDEFRKAPRAVESFTNRLRSLNHRIHQLPFDDRNAVQSVLYTELEKVLMRFEELEWLGPHSGPVPRRHIASEAIHGYGVRSDKIDDCLDRLPVAEKLATSTVLHRELEGVVTLFEHHQWLRGRRIQRTFPPQSQLWN